MAAQSNTAEAQNAARKSAIQSELAQLSATLGTVSSQINTLTTEQGNLNVYLGNWENQKAIYSGSDILSEVVITNEFEGVCADKIKIEFGNCIQEMDQTYNGVSGLNGNVGTQIARLREYATTIRSKITSLQNELSTL